MKVKMYEILRMKDIFQRLLDRKMPVRLAYKMNNFTLAIDKELGFYHQELNKILQEYAQKDERGEFLLSEDREQVLIKPEYTETVRDKIVELESLDIDFPDKKITLDELDRFDFTIAELNALMPILEEE